MGYGPNRQKENNAENATANQNPDQHIQRIKAEHGGEPNPQRRAAHLRDT